MSVMTDSNLQKLTDLLQSFEHAMLVTQRDSDLRSRPMAIGDVTDNGRVRFITRDDSAKLDELDKRSDVNVAAQDDHKFLSLTGNARISKSRDLIDEAWQSGQEPWFSEGKDDPHVVVIEVIPTYAEYWDRSNEGFVTQIIEGIRQAGSGERPDGYPFGEQAKVDFSDKPV